MADKRVIEQTASSEIYNDDWFLKDSVLNGTTKISAENLAKGLIDNVDASDIAYDNSSSGLEADNVDGAIDELSSEKANLSDLASVATSGEAEDVSYDNTTSGLTATNVQDAIDETFENAGKVDDVKVDGTSVVTNKVAEIEIPVKDVQVKTDSTYDSVVDASGNAKIDLSSVTAYGEVSNLPQAIATFTDGADDIPMKSLVAGIEPVQDLHGYDSPWVGGAGKNKFNVNYYGSTTTYFNRVDTTFINKEVDSRNDFRLLVQTFNNGTFISESNQEVITSAGRYSVIINIPSTPTFIRIKHNGSSNDLTLDYPFTQTGQYTISLTVVKTNPSTVGGLEFKDIQLESGSTATSYAPYSNICPISGWDEANVTVADDVENPTVSNVYTIDLDGTRYGGELDVVSGVLTVTHEIADLPSLGWGKSTNTANIYFYVLYTSGANGTYNEPATNVISNIYTPKSRNSLTNTQGTVGISAEANALYIADGRFDNYTVTQFKEAMSDVQLLLPLATPLTIQLTPTAVKSLLGSNNVWADTGDINECVYRRDMSSTIDDIIARLEALEG